MPPSNDRPNPPAQARVLRIGSVSYLNAKPLIHGLEEFDDLKLTLDVPANLLQGLSSGQLDIALLPVIDYQRMPGLKIVPSGGIGSDGETLTVRIFSPVPLDKIITLACDPDSHTSVALAQIVLAELFGIKPKLVDLRGNLTPDAARLLIGDKVVTHAPENMPHQLDLGAGWKQLTTMPFVFAVWTARAGVDLGDLPERLNNAREKGLADLPAIVSRHAVPNGWPAELAMTYLSRNLKFEIGPRQIAAITRFHKLARIHGIISELLPLEIY
jgi:chorismate dehydratase